MIIQYKINIAECKSKTTKATAMLLAWRQDLAHPLTYVDWIAGLFGVY